MARPGPWVSITRGGRRTEGGARRTLVGRRAALSIAHHRDLRRSPARSIQEVTSLPKTVLRPPTSGLRSLPKRRGWIEPDGAAAGDPRGARAREEQDAERPGQAGSRERPYFVQQRGDEAREREAARNPR